MKRILYLSDLYNFYVTQNKNVKFSSKDNDTTIVVHIDEPLTYDKDVDNDLLMYTPIRLCHTLSNRNKSYISDKAMKEAIPTAYNMPILSYIYKDDNDEFQFAGHEFFVNADNEIEYEEQPTGVIPESAGLKLVKYDNDDKSYLEGVGIIWRTYSKAANIIEREKELSVSVELVVDELSFNSKTKELVIDKFRFSGVTILGKDRETGAEIQPGMENSKISIADFSEVNNSLFSQNDKVIKLLSELNEKLDGLNIDQNLRKEEAMKDNFEEKTEEEIKDSPSAEVFDGEENPEETDYYEEEGGGDNGDPPVDDPTDPPTDNPTDPPADDPTDPPADDPTDPPADDDDDPSGIPLGQRDDDDTAGSKKYSIDYTVEVDGVKKDFSVSLKEKLNALTILVNDTYGEVDGAWYDCDVIEETKTVEFHDWWANKHYRQSYSVKKDVYSLKGDRVETFVSFLTADEKSQLENMKANYSSIESELESYKAEPDKQAVLAEKCYAQITDTDAYKELAKQETHFSMSVDEVRAELDRQLLEYAKGNEIKFSAKETEKKEVSVKVFGNLSKKGSTVTNGRYGGIFKK